ncbi:hypothetical protein PV326_009141 [Microctonus aethiopoides]|uniref:15-hydroxyprostaglandin dehydrogenase [NAD(+)] n=1 Tax=Microctonus aethiopoides TaxID=144406 RepID=A0AA39FMQ7_9HYME|nr:hypothetical protein PV326_009141 [Microctonus aethiopoides]KAK0172485.1 hypothetical protein PV328_005796 [Microctonus aethiopoides]
MEFQGRKNRRASAEEKAKELEVIKGLVCGKNVVITGGASGLGYSFVNHFLQHGAKRVAIIDVNASAGERAVKAVAKLYGEEKVIFIHADTSNYSQMLDTFTQLSTSMDSIDIVINNAGILDEKRWTKEVAVNIGGMVSVATLALRFMRKDQGGHGGVLVNVAQYFDFKFTAHLPIYTATKFAIIALSQSLGASYHADNTGVRVMALCPGLTETALTIDSPNKLLSRVMKVDFVKNLEQLSIQTPYIVAEGLMTILKCGESGSVWVVENGKTPFEIETPAYKSLKRQYKNNFIPSPMIHMMRGRPIRETYDDMRSGLTSCG